MCVETVWRMTAFAFDGLAKNLVPRTKWRPPAFPIYCGENRDARSSYRCREMHGAGVVSQIKLTFPKQRLRFANAQLAGGIFPRFPFGNQPSTLFAIFRTAKNY